MSINWTMIFDEIFDPIELCNWGVSSTDKSFCWVIADLIIYFWFMNPHLRIMQWHFILMQFNIRQNFSHMHQDFRSLAQHAIMRTNFFFFILFLSLFRLKWHRKNIWKQKQRANNFIGQMTRNNLNQKHFNITRKMLRFRKTKTTV